MAVFKEVEAADWQKSAIASVGGKVRTSCREPGWVRFGTWATPTMISEITSRGQNA